MSHVGELLDRERAWLEDAGHPELWPQYEQALRRSFAYQRAELADRMDDLGRRIWAQLPPIFHRRPQG